MSHSICVSIMVCAHVVIINNYSQCAALFWWLQSNIGTIKRTRYCAPYQDVTDSFKEGCIGYHCYPGLSVCSTETAALI